MKEPDFDAMKKGRIVYLPPRYMTINTACEQLIEAEEFFLFGLSFLFGRVAEGTPSFLLHGLDFELQKMVGPNLGL